jgi:uncharacterized SAM-binding protein YcdF (DUF218 family)
MLPSSRGAYFVRMKKLADFGVALRVLLQRVMRVARPIARRVVMASGILLLLMVVLACTRLPFDAHRWLGSAAGECEAPPEAIIVLGGSGMPSGPELVRMFRAAELAAQWPMARVVVIHPGPPSAINAMADELRLRGVGAERISLVNEGNNTREQALILDRVLSKSGPVAVVSSPENMYRTLRTFRKAGFTGACGAPAWDHAMMHNFEYGHGAIGGKAWVPDVSGDPVLRYTFWNYLKLEITCLREYVAIAYYRLNGWI